jgi:hypothetical protein
MAHPITSIKKAQNYANALMLIGLAVLIYTQDWWPGIMLAIGLPIALRQFLLGRTYDMLISLLVFVGTYVTVEFDIEWRIFLPILFSLGAIYILLREYLGVGETEQDKEEEIEQEIEEKKQKRRKK